MECLIEKIIVYSESNIEISFKFQDEFERILSEVKDLKYNNIEKPHSLIYRLCGIFFA